MDHPLPEPEFNDLALQVFAHQFERNAPYQAYCLRRGAVPGTVRRWAEVPAVPTDAFKAADLSTVPPERIGVTYRTSGTTVTGARGRHLLPDTRLYDASLLPNFRAHLLPDRESIRIGVLGPTGRWFPDSSLGHMHTRVMEAFGTAGSEVFWSPEGGRFDALAAWLDRASREGEPVMLLGTAFAFVHFLDRLVATGRSFTLPPGSRLMDTGGYKGRSREVPKAELYNTYSRLLGIDPIHIVNEYGMTEMGSQFYDNVLRRGVGGAASAVDRRVKEPPPWVRTLVVDPDSLTPVPPGVVGLLRHFDLANLHTVAAIQTDDLGQERAGGFEILGRAAGAELRGCSLTAEELP